MKRTNFFPEERNLPVEAVRQTDIDLIRASLDMARDSALRGDHPFGALLVDRDHNILLKAGNTVVTERDCTGHAETNLMRLASRKYSYEFLATCSVYTSTEPCPMCSGAIFWGNVRRVVYGLSQERLYQIVGDETSGDALYLPCQEVFASSGDVYEVIGPLVEEEAALVHESYWGARE